MESVIILVLLGLGIAVGQDVPVVCGGFIQAKFGQVDFTKIKVKEPADSDVANRSTLVNLYSVDGTLKYSTECAPNNGYFLLPLYDQGEYLVRTVPPSGWMITPNEVPLVVEGSKDPCSSGKDILFHLIGFKVEGQVTSGDHLDGPEGVEISLSSTVTGDDTDELTIRHVYTLMDGRFMIEGVSPGSYRLSASHPVWKVSEDTIEVTVVDEPVTTPRGLKVLGYDVKGEVMSGGEPVENVALFLFLQPGKNSVQVDCSMKVPLSVSPRPKEAPLCSVLSDDSGRFVFHPLPPGSYSLVPVYQQEQLVFEVHPIELNFTVSNNSLILPVSFEVQGFSVTGQIILTHEGSPVPGAHVLLGDNYAAVTDELGQYHLMNVTTGTYILKIEAQGMQFEPREVHISPASPTLSPLSPNKYLVCGDVEESISTAASGEFRTREIRVSSNGHLITTTTTNEDGSFCFYLPLGEYFVKVVVPPEEAERGLLILPEKQFMAMLDTPVSSRIIFNQFLASLSGSVTCIENCPQLNIHLKRIQKGKQELIAQVSSRGKEAHFSLTKVLPGNVVVALDHTSWCWDSPKIQVNIVKGSQPSLHFTHVGYTMKYEHYYQQNESASEAMLHGRDSLCLKNPGLYQIEPQSCHEFEKAIYYFDTSSPGTVVLQSTRHSLNIPVHTGCEDPSLSLVIRSAGNKETLLPKNIEKEKKDYWVYLFVAVVRPLEDLEIQPLSSLLMFSPSSLNWTVDKNCPETTTIFQGSPGEIIKGQVEPSLSDVAITVDLGSDGRITTYTNDLGHYRVGPVRGGSHISVSAILDGYFFEQIGNSYSFKSIKLCDITVQVSNASGGPLAGVLISMSGENYRQNNFTDNEGILSYPPLVPGQYFLKPFLREFEFTPSSLLAKFTEGCLERILFSGKRVTFSCLGLVTTLNRQPLEGISVQAFGRGISEKCSFSEAVTTDSEGIYRLHGLTPGCHYNVSLKLDGKRSHSLPTFRSLIVEETDVSKVDFLMLPQTKFIQLTGWVDVDPKFVGSLKAEVYINGSMEETPINSVSIENVGFFYFPLLPLLPKEDYLILLQSSLSTYSYKYSTIEKVVSGINDSHVILKFTAQELIMEKEAQSKGSVLALVLVIAIAFALVNLEKVFSWAQNLIPLTLNTYYNNQKYNSQKKSK